MAFIKDFTYDIFISYAHVDNLPTSYVNPGWIEKFYKDLDTLLTRRIGRYNFRSRFYTEEARNLSLGK
jgi:hypothetical protein